MSQRGQKPLDTEPLDMEAEDSTCWKPLAGNVIENTSLCVVARCKLAHYESMVTRTRDTNLHNYYYRSWQYDRICFEKLKPTKVSSARILGVQVSRCPK
jgi:hypothetical protein